jgi:hypothetical protein
MACLDSINSPSRNFILGNLKTGYSQEVRQSKSEYLPVQERQQNCTSRILHVQITLIEPTRGVLRYEGFTEKSSRIGNVFVEQSHTG